MSALNIPVKQIDHLRTLTFVIFRHNPADSNSSPHLQSYKVEEADSMTLFIALNDIRENQDPTLACRTLTKNLSDEIHLRPLPGFALIGDLSVNTGKWMRAMSQRLETWIHLQEESLNLSKLEERMEPKLAQDIYELERCIECGCCIAACGSAQMRDDFIGAVGINQIARFTIDPRDNRTDADYYRVIGDDTGVFGCMTLLGCEDMCPKDLPLAQQIAYMRKKMAVLTWR